MTQDTLQEPGVELKVFFEVDDYMYFYSDSLTGERSDDDEQRQRPRRRFDVPVVRELGDDERRRRTKSPLNLQGWCRQWRQGRRRRRKEGAARYGTLIVSPTSYERRRPSGTAGAQRRAAQRHRYDSRLCINITGDTLHTQYCDVTAKVLTRPGT